MPSEPLFAACFNRPYVPHAATMLRSFAAATTTASRWYLVGDDTVDDETLERLVAFGRSCGLKAEGKRIPGPLVAPFEDQARYPRSAWYRAALADAFPGDDRLVYLDSDLLVLQDLRPLWETPIADGDLFAALCNPSYGDGGVLNNERLGMPHDAPYFNSGVMVMDLARMREERFRERTIEFVLRPDRPPVFFADQDAFNVAFAGQWTPLDPKWNCLTVILQPFILGATWADDVNHSVMDLERAARSPAIVHFEGPPVLKPWHRRCVHPFARLYREYRAMTPWPLSSMEGRRRDVALARLPFRVQTQLWSVQRYVHRKRGRY